MPRCIKFVNYYIYKHTSVGNVDTGFLYCINTYSGISKLPKIEDPELKRLVYIAIPYIDIGKSATITKEVVDTVEALLEIPDIAKLFEDYDEEVPDMPGSSKPEKKPDTKESKERAEKARKIIMKRKKASEEKDDKESSDKSDTESDDKKSDKTKESDSKSELKPDDKSEDKSEDKPEDESEDKSEDESEPETSEEDLLEVEDESDKEEAPKVDSEDLKEESDTEESEEDIPYIDEEIEEIEEIDDFDIKEFEKDMEELLEGVTDEMRILTEDMKEMEEEPPADLTSDIKSVINLGVKFREIPINKKFPLQESYPDILRKAQVMIQNLVTEVQAIMETRKSYEMRGLKKGRLHSGSLYKLAVPNVDVFSRNTLPGHDPTMVIYLLVDMSGSMGIGNRIGAARLATCVLGETCKTLQIKYKITGFSGDTHQQSATLYQIGTKMVCYIARMCEYHEKSHGYQWSSY